MIVITNDVYLRRPGVLHPKDEEVLRHGTKAISGPELLAMAERGELDKDDVTPVRQADPESGLIELGPDEIQTLAKLAGEAGGIFDKQAMRHVASHKRAMQVRRLRCKLHYSWRLVAQECHNNWMVADWSPPSNQIMGMSLCEHAAKTLGEDHTKDPWNDC